MEQVDPFQDSMLCDISEQSSLEPIIGLDVCGNFGLDNIMTEPLRERFDYVSILKNFEKVKAYSSNSQTGKQNNRHVTFNNETVILRYDTEMPTVMEQIAISETALLQDEKHTAAKFQKPVTSSEKVKSTQAQLLPEETSFSEKKSFYKNLQSLLWKQFPQSDEFLNYEKAVLKISEEELETTSILTEEEEREFQLDIAKPYDNSEILDLGLEVPIVKACPKQKASTSMPILSAKSKSVFNRFPNTKFVEFMNKIKEKGEL